MGPLPAAPGCDCHICRPARSCSVDEQRSIDMVLQHGWQVMLVSESGACASSEHDHAHDETPSDEPDFAYTVGLGHRCGHPELLMSGLDPQLMHRALNEIAGRVMRGRRLAPGQVLEGVLGGVPVVLERVSEQGLRETVIWSGWFHRRTPDALVVVWPTRSGLFDWQPGAPDVLALRQPREWRDPIDHTGGVATVPAWNFPVPADRRAFTCTHVVDQGESILWAARQFDPERGEDWSFHCGVAGHPIKDMRMVHLAHLVRSAPSLLELAGLPQDHEAWRDHVDAPWQEAHLGHDA